MDFSIEQIELARSIVKSFEKKLKSKLRKNGIKRDSYYLEFSTCGSAEGEEYAYRDDCVYLEQITCFNPGLGLGGKIMRSMMHVADRMNIILVLEAQSQKFDHRKKNWHEFSLASIRKQAFRFKVPSQEELEAWYLSLGFSYVNQDENYLMVRNPGTPIPLKSKILEK